MSASSTTPETVAATSASEVTAADTSPETSTSTANADASDAAPAAASSDVPASSADAADAAPADASGAQDAAAQDGAASDDDDGEEGEEEGDGEKGAEGDAEGGAPGEKKKKRRRKKKKKPEGAEGAPAGDGQRPRPHHERAPFHVGEEVFGKVTAVLETAIMVDLSGKALAIFDRTEMEPDDLVPAVGDRFVARIHNDGGRGGLVVMTRKPLREEEMKPVVEQASKDGTLIEGLITGVIKGGVEVDIKGLRAFAPASGMDLHPAHANFAALVGQRLQFKVLQFKAGGRDVVVSRRPMLEAEAHERRKKALETLQEGQVLEGVVRTVVEWGAFVALPEVESLEGLVHASEVGHDPRARIADQLKAGDRFPVKITKIDDKGKIWLSRRALIEDPWAEARRKFAPGTRHTGKVTKLEPFGAFITLEEGFDGLLHIGDLSFERIEHPKEVLKEGQDFDVVVASFDGRTKKISLHPAPPADRPPEERQKLMRGSLIKVEVVKGEATGVIVRILGLTGRTARGYIPAGQTGTPRGTDLSKSFKRGTQLDVKVVDIDPKRGEPKLSVKGFEEEEERRMHRDYRAKVKAEGGFGTLGDLLAAKLKKS